jgi:hypothetical protein
MKRKDVNEIAFSVVQQAIGAMPKHTAEQRKAEAAALGRKGGLKGGPARKRKLSQSRLKAIGKLGAAKRWIETKK